MQQYNQSGERFRIDGHCQSACMLFLGIRNVCIGPGASLLFHAAHDDRRVRSEPFVKLFLQHYNAKLRGFLLAQHALDEMETFLHRLGQRHGPQVRVPAVPGLTARRRRGGQ